MKRNQYLAMAAGLLVLTSILTGGTRSAFAQGKKQEGAGKKETALVLALKGLELTDAQKDKIKEIAKKYRDERKDMVTGSADSATADGDKPKMSPENRAKIAELEMKQIAEVKAILTPEQLAKFQTALDAAKADRSGGPMGDMVAKLALTDEQKQKIEPILKESGEAMRALQSDTTSEPREKRKKMMEIWNGAKEKIRPLLTAEQQKTLDEMKGMRGGRRGGGRPS